MALLSYGHVFSAAESLIEPPFIIGSPYSHAKLIEVIVHKSPRLADVPMTLAALPPKKGNEPPLPAKDRMHGAELSGKHWKLTHRVAGVGFAVAPGQTHRMKLSLKLPKGFEFDGPTRITSFQRNDGHIITGSAILELVPATGSTSTTSANTVILRRANRRDRGGEHHLGVGRRVGDHLPGHGARVGRFDDA